MSSGGSGEGNSVEGIGFPRLERERRGTGRLYCYHIVNKKGLRVIKLRVLNLILLQQLRIGF